MKGGQRRPQRRAGKHSSFSSIAMRALLDITRKLGIRDGEARCLRQQPGSRRRSPPPATASPAALQLRAAHRTALLPFRSCARCLLASPASAPHWRATSCCCRCATRRACRLAPTSCPNCSWPRCCSRSWRRRSPPPSWREPPPGSAGCSSSSDSYRYPFWVRHAGFGGLSIGRTSALFSLFLFRNPPM